MIDCIAECAEWQREAPGSTHFDACPNKSVFVPPPPVPVAKKKRCQRCGTPEGQSHPAWCQLESYERLVADKMPQFKMENGQWHDATEDLTLLRTALAQAHWSLRYTLSRLRAENGAVPHDEDGSVLDTDLDRIYRTADSVLADPTGKTACQEWTKLQEVITALRVCEASRESGFGDGKYWDKLMQKLNALDNTDTGSLHGPAKERT